MACPGSQLTNGLAWIQTLVLESVIINLYTVISFNPRILEPDVLPLLHIIMVHFILKTKHLCHLCV